MSLIPFGFGMDPLFGDLGTFGGLGSLGMGVGGPTRTSRSVWPSSSTALVPTDDRQLLDFGRLAADPLPVDVEDREQEYIVRVHQREAGMRKKDLRVDVENGMLTIRGERESESGDPASGSYSRRYRSVSRSMSLPEHVDQSKIEACYEGNNLMIHLPKLTGAPGARRSIQIGGGTGMGTGMGKEREEEKQGQGVGQGLGQGQMHGQTHGQSHGQTPTHGQTLGAGAGVGQAPGVTPTHGGGATHAQGTTPTTRA